ncbi:MAG: YheU family protein [bacterium]|nr:YheU family protein [bacterium]
MASTRSRPDRRGPDAEPLPPRANLRGVIVPHRKLSPEALAAVVEEFVTRDGTEHTDAELKVEHVLRALDRGDLVLVYDSDSETCNILQPDQIDVSGS